MIRPYFISNAPKLSHEIWVRLGNALLVQMLVENERERQTPIEWRRKSLAEIRAPKISQLHSALDAAGTLHPTIEGSVLGTVDFFGLAAVRLADSDDQVARLRLADLPEHVRFHEGLHHHWSRLTAPEAASYIVRLHGSPGILDWLLDLVVDYFEGMTLEDVLGPAPVAEVVPPLSRDELAVLAVKTVVLATPEGRQVARDDFRAHLQEAGFNKDDADRLRARAVPDDWRDGRRRRAGVMMPLHEVLAELEANSLADLMGRLASEDVTYVATPEEVADAREAERELFARIGRELPAHAVWAPAAPGAASSTSAKSTHTGPMRDVDEAQTKREHKAAPLWGLSAGVPDCERECRTHRSRGHPVRNG